MPKIDIKRAELVWRGKYDDNGKLVPVDRPGPYPFQIIESVNAPRIEKGTPAPHTSLFDYRQGNEGAAFEDGWKNKLIWGDNKLVMSSLLEKFAGKIDLIYIDPPFATGADFTLDVEIGEKGETLHKGHSIIEEKAYLDTWGQGIDSFLAMMYERLSLMKDLLSDKGSIYVHLDWHVGHYLKLVLDELFGENNFKNEIVWTYTGPSVPGQKQFSRKHDIIFWYTKSSAKWIFNKDDIRIPYHETTASKFESEGTGFGGTAADLSLGKIPEDWWYLPVVSRVRTEILGYPTQKTESLLERIIKASSNEGSLVADFFCGSGTTCAVAEKLNRRWIGVDLGRYAIHTTRKRLLEIESSKSLTDDKKAYGKPAKPFEILNLGKYERQAWQIKAYGFDPPTTAALYIKDMLKLYGAQPLKDCPCNHIHGKKGAALVYVGDAVSPVTIQEITGALNDAKDMGVKELHVLGWEYEMGLSSAIGEIAAQKGVRLKRRVIQNEVPGKSALERGDVRFFELAYFEPELAVSKLKFSVRLKKFAIPHTDLIPKEVSEKITKWSDWIDYWAVDFDFRSGAFNNAWTSYRAKSGRTLKLSASHEYKKSGAYKVFIKIIDIFGIDTSQVFDVEVG